MNMFMFSVGRPVMMTTNPKIFNPTSGKTEHRQQGKFSIWVSIDALLFPHARYVSKEEGKMYLCTSSIPLVSLGGRERGKQVEMLNTGLNWFFLRSLSLWAGAARGTGGVQHLHPILWARGSLHIHAVSAGGAVLVRGPVRERGSWDTTAGRRPGLQWVAWSRSWSWPCFKPPPLIRLRPSLAPPQLSPSHTYILTLCDLCTLLTFSRRHILLFCPAVIYILSCFFFWPVYQ